MSRHTVSALFSRERDDFTTYDIEVVVTGSVGMCGDEYQPRAESVVVDGMQDVWCALLPDEQERILDLLTFAEHDRQQAFEKHPFAKLADELRAKLAVTR